MFNTMFDRGSLPALENWIHFTDARHAVIADNIANIETPGYKTKGVPEGEFRKLMLQAFGAQKQSPLGIFELGRRPGVSPKPGGGLAVKSLEADVRRSGILRHSENNVDMDLEFGKLVENGMLHSTLTSLLSQQFELLREAIRERVS